MVAYSRSQYGDAYRGGYDPGMYNQINNYDYANWGFIILYLVVIIGSLLGNGLFLAVVKKNPNLHRTVHYLLSTMAVRDLIVTVLVIPFVIDSQAVNLMEWKAGDALCKLYSFLDYGTGGFLVLILGFFLYFWYRKQEAYMTEEGSTVVRKNRMHKWAIPLVWVLGLGIAIPAGALAFQSSNPSVGRRTCSVWNGRGSSSSHYYVELATVIAGFLAPMALILFPVIALCMQLSGSREPRLDPPHSRTAATAIALGIVWAVTRGPSQVYLLMKLFHQSSMGMKVDMRFGTPYAITAFNTDITINSLIYVACLLHPIIYFAINPDYRSGLRVVWSDLYCNKDPVQREREEEARRQRRAQQRQYPAKNRAMPNMRANQEPLLQHKQPIIMGAPQPGMVAMPPGQQYYPQPQAMMTPGGVQQPLLASPAGQQMLYPDQQFLDNSFERMSPQLPPVFEYDGLKYIDTARVEPKIGYSPQKTPPKTPETPHFRSKPFTIPIVANQPTWSPPPPGSEVEMQDMAGPIATSEPKPRPESFHLEDMDQSPGNTLRTRRSQQQSPEVEQLSESPGQRNRRKTKESQENYNGNGLHSSRPTSPDQRPGSRQAGVEIVITGRTRSRTDLCPDVPRSKFEHSV